MAKIVSKNGLAFELIPSGDPVLTEVDDIIENL